MATSAWRFYRIMKSRLFDGSIDLNTSVFTMHLYTSQGGAWGGTGLDTSTSASLSSQLTEGAGGYLTAGITLLQLTMTQSGSVGTWDVSDVVFTASGSDMSDVKFAVIKHSGLPVCYSELSTAGFNVSSGNTLTIQIAASGIFEITGGET